LGCRYGAAILAASNRNSIGNSRWRITASMKSNRVVAIDLFCCLGDGLV
jgi:hypothetical protein